MGYMVDGLKLDGRRSRGKKRENSTSVPSPTEAKIAITLFPTWVYHSLNKWLRANRERKDACTALAKVIDTYISAASSAYKDMPEDISLD